MVWLARQDEPVNRVVAIKLLRPDRDHGGIRARFRREFQILARLDHPNIAKFVDAGEDLNGSCWFAMQFVGGRSLLDHCAHADPPIGERVQLACAVCDAVDHAHRAGVLHRDIKPSNVLVETSLGQPVPKLIDFGVARDLQDPETRITQGHVRIGTPRYMAPEVRLRGGEAATVQSDVYSLGILIAETLGLRIGVDGGADLDAASTIDQVAAVLEEANQRMRSAASGGSPASAGCWRAALGADAGLIRVLATAMAPAPAQRYDSAASLRSDLAAWIRGDPMSVSPTTEWRLGLGRGFGRTAAFACVGVAALLAGWWMGVSSSSDLDSRTSLAAGRSEVALNAAAELVRLSAPDAAARRTAPMRAEDLDRLAATILPSIASNPSARLPLLISLVDLYESESSRGRALRLLIPQLAGIAALGDEEFGSALRQLGMGRVSLLAAADTNAAVALLSRLDARQAAQLDRRTRWRLFVDCLCARIAWAPCVATSDQDVLLASAQLCSELESDVQARRTAVALYRVAVLFRDARATSACREVDSSIAVIQQSLVASDPIRVELEARVALARCADFVAYEQDLQAIELLRVRASEVLGAAHPLTIALAFSVAKTCLERGDARSGWNAYRALWRSDLEHGFEPADESRYRLAVGAALAWRSCDYESAAEMALLEMSFGPSSLADRAAEARRLSEEVFAAVQADWGRIDLARSVERQIRADERHAGH